MIVKEWRRVWKVKRSDRKGFWIVKRLDRKGVWIVNGLDRKSLESKGVG